MAQLSPRHIAQMVDSHYRIHLGCYFSSVTFSERRISATSSIREGIWNHTWLRPPAADKEFDSLASAVEHVYVDASAVDPTTLWTVFDREIWMQLNGQPPDCKPAINLSMVGENSGLTSVLSAVISECFSQEYAKAADASMAQESAVTRSYYVASHRGSHFGAISYHQLGRWSAIHDVAVLPEYRGKGLGTSLVTALLHLLDATEQPYLQCEDGWLPKFYSACGFSQTHRRIGLRRPNPMDTT